MAIADKSKLYLGVPILNPDKIVATFTGTFTLSGASLTEGSEPIENTYGAQAFPISSFTLDGGTYFGDNDQTPTLAVITTAVTASELTYYWVNYVGGTNTVTYRTVLVSMT